MSVFGYAKTKLSLVDYKMAFGWLRKLAVVCLVISYLALAYSLVGFNLIPLKFLLPVLAVDGFVVLWFSFIGFRKELSAIKSLMLIIASILFIIVSLYAFSASNSLTSFLNNIHGGNYVDIEYDIIAKKDQHVKLGAVTDGSIGVLTVNAKNRAVVSQLNKYTKADIKSFDNVAAQTTNLDDNSVGMLLMSDSQLDLIKENYSSFYQGVEVLAKFKVRVRETTSKVDGTDTTKPFIVYISGIDTYGDVATVSRSDVNILAVVNPKNHKILLVNTPRDYYVKLHGINGVKDKLTHTGIYGVNMSVQTLEDLYDVSIDDYIRVNFTSLVSVVDNLGGVKVYSNNTFSAGKYSFTEGYNQLNGEQALAFSRARYAFANGDRTRGENQEQVIKAIIEKLNNPSVLLNYQQILASMQKALQTDVTLNDVTSLVKYQLNDMSKWSVKSISVNGTDSHNYTYSMGNIKLYVMEPDQTSLNTAKSEITQYLQ